MMNYRRKSNRMIGGFKSTKYRVDREYRDHAFQEELKRKRDQSIYLTPINIYSVLDKEEIKQIKETSPQVEAVIKVKKKGKVWLLWLPNLKDIVVA